MIWYIEGSGFFITVITLFLAFLTGTLKFCLQSRCSEFICCSREGFLIVKRDSKAENEELKIEMSGMGMKKNESVKDEIPLLTKEPENHV